MNRMEKWARTYLSFFFKLLWFIVELCIFAGMTVALVFCWHFSFTAGMICSAISLSIVLAFIADKYVEKD